MLRDCLIPSMFLFPFPNHPFLQYFLLLTDTMSAIHLLVLPLSSLMVIGRPSLIRSRAAGQSSCPDNTLKSGSLKTTASPAIPFPMAYRKCKLQWHSHMVICSKLMPFLQNVFTNLARNYPKCHECAHTYFTKLPHQSWMDQSGWWETVNAPTLPNSGVQLPASDNYN